MRLLTHIRSRSAVLGDRNDRGMMSMVMVVIIIGMGLSALMVPIVVTQSRSTSNTDARVQALHQAESGINAMLGRLRGATDPLIGYRLTSNLCPAASSSGSPTNGYSAAARYYTSDPQLTPSIGGTRTELFCPFDVGSIVPSFARITSTGTDSRGGSVVARTLATTYALTVANTTGGQIRFNPGNDLSQTKCLEAGALSAPVSVTACRSPATVAAAGTQLFFYNSDLTLQLAMSITAATPFGLCVDSTAPPLVSLRPCLSPGKAQYNEQWSLDANAAFAETAPDQSRFCLYSSDGTSIGAKNCPLGGSYDATASSWLPTPSSGAGAAGAASGQLANLSQFGRCAQIKNSSVTLLPCDQNSDFSKVNAYQKFAYDSTTYHWVTTNPADPADPTAYCLTSQGNQNAVTVTVCGQDPSQKWIDRGAALADQADASQYLEDMRYRIEQGTLCLSLSPTAGADPNSNITTQTCDGTSRQKWNANPDPKSSTLRNTSEN